MPVVAIYFVSVIVSLMAGVIFWCLWQVFVEKPDWLFDGSQKL